MSEIWLSVGSTPGAIRAVLKNINVWRGLEVGRWMFTFELSSKQQSVVGSGPGTACGSTSISLALWSKTAGTSR